MTFDELNRYRALKIRLKKYNTELETLEILLSEIKTDSDLDNEIQALRALVIQGKKELIHELAYLIQYIESIEDVETQSIFVSRFIEGKTYEQIGAEFFMHQSNVFYKIKSQIQ